MSKIPFLSCHLMKPRMIPTVLSFFLPLKIWKASNKYFSKSFTFYCFQIGIGADGKPTIVAPTPKQEVMTQIDKPVREMRDNWKDFPADIWNQSSHRITNEKRDFSTARNAEYHKLSFPLYAFFRVFHLSFPFYPVVSFPLNQLVSQLLRSFPPRDSLSIWCVKRNSSFIFVSICRILLWRLR